MAKWKKQTFRLDGGYDWKAKPGNKVFVADRGAARFDFPADWVFVPETGCLKFYDRQPPDDNCLLEVTVFHLPAGPDWSLLPLPQQLDAATADDRPDAATRGQTVHIKRSDLEIAWLETRWIDPGEQREARSRSGLARRAEIQILLTLTFWSDDRARLDPIWDELLRSLRLGEYIALPVQRGGN